jgi:hypothetical protein
MLDFSMDQTDRSGSTVMTAYPIDYKPMWEEAARGLSLLANSLSTPSGAGRLFRR